MSKAFVCNHVVVFILVVVIMGMFSLNAYASTADTHVKIDINGGKITIAAPNASQDPSDTTGFGSIFKNYKALAQGFFGCCALTSILLFFVEVCKLGAAGDNERNRAAAIKGILIAGIAVAMFGGITVIVSLFWNLLAP